ncbi:OmpA family protein [Pantoea sp. 18069]|uniref:OmpA family protein n=1 Tax=Pantoea sp. 18069 TaxID=2681415 RepID=UPI00135BA166|nr:OmpA family protein [Pantoea sp. 18069]
MFKNYPLYTSLLLACGLAACSSGPGSSAQRSANHYAFGKAPPVAADNARVAPVIAQPVQARKGPDNVAHIVYFDFDSYTVRPVDRPILESHARWLRSNPQQSLVLQGHTDSRGGIEYNLALGNKRAQAVRSSLQLLGVEQHRVEAVSYGKEQLADPGTSDAAHQRNRRVEFEYR